MLASCDNGTSCRWCPVDAADDDVPRVGNSGMMDNDDDDDEEDDDDDDDDDGEGNSEERGRRRRRRLVFRIDILAECILFLF